MPGIGGDERVERFRYIVKALEQTRDHLISQATLAEIASRHVYTPVTPRWVQNNWGFITRWVHEDYPELWVFRPQWPWGHLVGATTKVSYPKATLYQRYRMAASQITNDLNDGNLRALAMVDPGMAAMLKRYEAFLNKADQIEREFRQLLDSLVDLPPATPAMTAHL